MILKMMPHNHQWHRIILLHILIILIFVPTYSFSQEQSNNLDDLVKLSNKTYGADDRLDYGEIYYPKNASTISHPFLISDYWNNGTIFINGIKFKNALLKYNIEKDEVFYKGDNPSVLILTKSYIDSLIINDRLFINTDKLNFKNKMGFVEQLNKGRYTSYLKHKIGITQVTTTSSVSLKYMTPKFVVYLSHHDQLININTKRSLLYYFAPNKKDIQRFLKRNKIRYKKASQLQLISLLKYCDSFSTNPEIE